ncbi:hypothetical protein H4582DRAFT_2061912 [Lactarius indigo]|nr:hypothetical protein H4582DRAFT_2061912 [Lactarius indigo]
MTARKETKELMGTERTGYYVVFLDRFGRLCEATLNPDATKDAQFAMNVNPSRVGRYVLPISLLPNWTKTFALLTLVLARRQVSPPSSASFRLSAPVAWAAHHKNNSHLLALI